MAKPLIAVINDDPAFLESMGELLNDEGYRVVPHYVTEGAFAVLQQEWPELIIVDLWVEYPTAGLQLIEELKADPRAARIPIIVCTAHLPLVQEKEADLRAQGCAVVHKPFDIDELTVTVARLLG